MKHAHIVECIDYKTNIRQALNDGSKISISYIVMELVEGGELFSYVKQRLFREKTCRYYFKQMLRAIHYSHSKGIAHRDLKLENILLDKNFNVKITDFGFSARVKGRDGSGIIHTCLGTKAFMAPEIIKGIKEFGDQPISY